MIEERQWEQITILSPITNVIIFLVLNNFFLRSLILQPKKFSIHKCLYFLNNVRRRWTWFDMTSTMPLIIENFEPNSCFALDSDAANPIQSLRLIKIVNSIITSRRIFYTTTKVWFATCEASQATTQSSRLHNVIKWNDQEWQSEWARERRSQRRNIYREWFWYFVTSVA